MAASPLHRVLFAACLGTLAACSPPAAPQPDKPPAPRSAAAQALHRPLDRAKAVEGQLQQAQDAQARQIEAATQ
ncbi:MULTISPECIES: hypothetical protein [Pseudoxanthomonas]|jgi:hypothetical protein|uniref:Uncharacterized protein n=1 Tax=Pseudoxanthomonas winnipegensis TaxID=2480810 RepID=A0A4Q8LD74_9GAMM|nr:MULTISPECIES: hypothetical protein [Pseudoxanthomonas]PZP60456.1 MAG: hypothetical protein DI597_13200 [Pseudoxanthomonas spadix]TAA26854.1 hypothetical protein EA660_06480 [Pseudoxanthomonas winnipegensis]TMN16710.1 hypothetical protein FF950_18140 [Pseudoxanthomonas sp. X-1]UAY75502.1 hypothetical protein LAJ50_04380 [Pseudoxanthomonas sp. X-1]